MWLCRFFVGLPWEGRSLFRHQRSDYVSIFALNAKGEVKMLHHPDKIIYPLLGWQAFAVIMMSLATGDPALAWRAVAGGLIAFIGFELLHLLSRGALGFGDVKLGALIGMGASMISWATLWWAFMIGSVGALVWALIKKPGQFAF